jgi:hypothetical protein
MPYRLLRTRKGALVLEYDAPGNVKAGIHVSRGKRYRTTTPQEMCARLIASGTVVLAQRLFPEEYAAEEQRRMAEER